MKIKNLIQRLRGESARSGKCFWKIIYEHALTSPPHLLSLERDYKKHLESCIECDGYQSSKGCYYTRK